MKQRVRNYEPADPRSLRQDRKQRLKDADQDDAHEFEALFPMRDQTTPEQKAEAERSKAAEKLVVEKSADKGFER